MGDNQIDYNTQFIILVLHFQSDMYLQFIRDCQ